jgi:amino acid transporter/mannitol/fructose-specific phosphotransferase system IIA component (Ntr-type)
MVKQKLKKEIGLFGVFAMSTGAMFSSGFFLLPGIASMYTGPSVFLAYILSAILIVPAMFCMAEISTAIPRAGGAYFIIDRAYGPLFGTIGGLGTYFALVLKSAFALVGMGAYTSLILDIPVDHIAVVLAVVFAVINIVGAKKSAGFQNIFVIILIFILGILIIDGLINLFGNNNINNIIGNNFVPFFEKGVGGLFATIGFVFVSYAGLTKVASIAEEIKNPERNIPLGMIISLAVTCLIYALGTFLMVSFINKEAFAKDLTPVASLTSHTLRWMPAKVALVVVVISAVAAFASTGNAGIMSSSRYPLAMARDKLLPTVFAKQHKKNHMPVFSIAITSFIIIFIIIFVSAEGIAKMASTFQLLIFFFINFAVIIFRSSKIETYDPGYHSPFYPYMQIFGMISCLALIVYLGMGPLLFSIALILVGIVWFNYYAKGKVRREGAIYHWFELLGSKKYDKIENEFFHIIREKGLREKDQFDQLIANASISFNKSTSLLSFKFKPYEDLVNDVAGKISDNIDIDNDKLVQQFLSLKSMDVEFIIPNVSISFASCEKVSSPIAYVVISPKGIRKKIVKNKIKSEDTIHVFFFIVAPSEDNKLLLRILSRLLDITDREHFKEEITSKQTPREVKEYLLHSERYINLRLSPYSQACLHFIGKKIKDIDLPKGLLIAIMERNGESITPGGETMLMEHDLLTIIGHPDKLKEFKKRYFSN